MALFTDAFTRADANLASGGDSWTQVDGTAGWGAVRSNKLACLTSDAAGAAYQCPDTGSMQHYAQARLATITDPSGPFLCCRLQDRNNFIGVRYDSSAGKLEAYRRNAGTLTSLVPASITCAVNDVIKLQVDSGSVWSIYKNGVLADTGNSGSGLSSLTSTRAGVVMRAVATNPWIDDFEANSWGAVGGGGIDFPSSPTVGQLFAPAGTGITYLWNGTGWTAITPAYSGCYKISSGVVSSAVAQFDIALPTGYHTHELLVSNYNHAVDLQPALLRFSQDGTTFLASGNYSWSYNAVSQTGVNTPGGGGSYNHIVITPNIVIAGANRSSFRLHMPVAEASGVQQVYTEAIIPASGGVMNRSVGMGMLASVAGPVMALRILPGSGNIARCIWQLNGFK